MQVASSPLQGVESVLAYFYRMSMKQHKFIKLRVKRTWAQISPLVFSSYVTLGKMLPRGQESS